MSKKFLGIILLFFLLNSTFSLAQIDLGKTFSIFLGKMPSVCTRAITPQCITCIFYVKVLPFLFFTAIFFLIFYYIAIQTITRQQVIIPGSPQPSQTLPSLATIEMKVFAILSVVLALILINIFTLETLLSQFRSWIGLLIFVVSMLLIRGIVRLAGIPGFLIAIIITAIVFAMFWSLIGGVASQLEELLRMCM